MPSAQTMLGRLNPFFTEETIHQLDPELFAPGANLATAAFKHGVAKNKFEKGVLASIPRGMQEMLRALVYDNLQRHTPLSITFAWAPAYDFELSVWECPGTAVSPGGITVLVRTRYPLDRHPSTLRAKRGKG